MKFIIRSGQAIFITCLVGKIITNRPNCFEATLRIWFMTNNTCNNIPQRVLNR